MMDESTYPLVDWNKLVALAGALRVTQDRIEALKGIRFDDQARDERLALQRSEIALKRQLRRLMADAQPRLIP